MAELVSRHTAAHPGMVLRNPDSELTQDQVDLIKRTIAKGATDDELALFIAQCNRTGLDPFLKQIHLVKRWDTNAGAMVAATQVGIDGFRLITERTGRYEGPLGPWWCGEDGVWTDVWLSNEPPVAARVGVLKAGFREPVYAVAMYREYMQTKKGGGANAMWAKMPANQLAKCAEAAAHRKAFPQELSGLYTVDEFPPEAPLISEGDYDDAPARGAAGLADRLKAQAAPAQAEVAEEPLDAEYRPAPAADDAILSPGQVTALSIAIKELQFGMTDEGKQRGRAFISWLAGRPEAVESVKDLSRAEAAAALDRLGGPGDNGKFMTDTVRLAEEVNKWTEELDYQRSAATEAAGEFPDESDLPAFEPDTKKARKIKGDPIATNDGIDAPPAADETVPF